MERNNAMHEDRWVSERISSLTPSEDWQPSAGKGLVRFRERTLRAESRRNWALITTAAAAVCLFVTAFPPIRTAAKRFCNDFHFANSVEEHVPDAAIIPGDNPTIQDATSGKAQQRKEQREIAEAANGGGVERSARGRSASGMSNAAIENITSDIMVSAADTRAPHGGGTLFLWGLLGGQEPTGRGDEGDDLSSMPLDVAPPPYDPIEPVSSQPEAVKNSDARCAVIELLGQSLRNRAFYEPTLLPPSAYLVGLPYTVMVSFTASGPARDIGTGEMEETRNGTGARRWTGSVGGFSLTRIMLNRFYDAGSRGPIPMRLQMIREIALGNLGGTPPDYTTDSIRTANATLDGTPLNCILISTKANVAPIRDWSEREYCIDSQSKLLRVYSAVPGIYVVFDYSHSTDFHGHVVPDRFTVTESGKVVLHGAIRVQDPDAASLSPARFTPTSQMATGGLGLIWPVLHVQSTAIAGGSNLLQPIIVHATLSPDGSVVEAEALQTLDQQLSRSAVDLVKKTKYDSTVDYGHPAQQEIFVTVE
jgi:hypothetical protein